jgi:hypothetical protein
MRVIFQVGYISKGSWKKADNSIGEANTLVLMVSAREMLLFYFLGLPGLALLLLFFFSKAEKRFVKRLSVCRWTQKS